MTIEPYLFFEGRCDEAIAFYREALDAEVLHLMRWSDSPEDASACPSGTVHPDKVMHATLRIGNTSVMVSDGMCSGTPQFNGVSLSITVDDDAQASHVFAALGEGGKVVASLEPTFFASSFGMVTDRFGVSWMVVTATT